MKVPEAIALAQEELDRLEQWSACAPGDTPATIAENLRHAMEVMRTALHYNDMTVRFFEVPDRFPRRWLLKPDSETASRYLNDLGTEARQFMARPRISQDGSDVVIEIDYDDPKEDR